MGRHKANSFELHCIRADATNSSTLSNSKVHVVEVSSYYGMPHPGGTRDSGDGPIPDAFQVMGQRVYPDILFVPSSCGGPECRLLTMKQIASAGCPLWTEGNDTARLPLGSVRWPVASLNSQPGMSNST